MRNPISHTLPLFIGSEIYRRSTYGSTHPLAIPRVSTAIDLCRAMGWLPDEHYLDSPVATVEQLCRFHDQDYVHVVQRAQSEGRLEEEERRRYNIGLNGNPIFGEIFDRPATSCGASIEAARILSGQEGVIYNPAGGTHHGRRDHASGFCYFNDPVLAILTFLDSGISRIAYVDFDAHHGDGVEAAFEDNPNVLTLSIHESNRWPRTGTVSDRGGERGAGTTRNLPVPSGLNDTELRYLVHEAVIPLVAGHQPDALVIQGGADALHDDPLSGLSLSNHALWDAIRAVLPLAPRALVLGGGGYNPWSVARAWAGVWATVHGIDVPEPHESIPLAAETVLRALTWKRSQGRNPPEHWFNAIADIRREGPIRDETRDLAVQVRLG